MFLSHTGLAGPESRTKAAPSEWILPTLNISVPVKPHWQHSRYCLVVSSNLVIDCLTAAMVVHTHSW